MKAQEIREMCSKNTCLDVFLEMVNKQSYPSHLKYKLKYRSKLRVY